MGNKPSRERIAKDSSGENDAETSSSSAPNDRYSTESGSIGTTRRDSEGTDASEGDVPSRRPTAMGRAPGGTVEARGSAEGYVAYDRGPDRQSLSTRDGLDVGGGRARTLQRLEAEFGSDRVRGWVEEGMPVATMGKPRDMRAFRERQADRPEEVPADIERRNETSVRRNAARNRDAGPAGEPRVPDAVRRVVSSPGRSLSEPVQREMNAELGDDFGDVRIHDGPKAAAAAESIDARALTVGNHVAFNDGEYEPDSPAGKRVLAHELTHVRQQTAGTVSMLPKADAKRASGRDAQLEQDATETARATVDDRRTVRRMGTKMHVQPKLEVSSPDDPAEREAERIARAVMAMPDPRGRGRSATVRRSVSTGGAGSAAKATAPAESERLIRSLQGGGDPIPDGARSFFEPRFGSDFEDVRLHTDSRADRLNRTLGAKAFTVGQDIFFRSDTYDPASTTGKRLMAHELAHVEQQRGNVSRRIQRAAAVISAIAGVAAAVLAGAGLALAASRGDVDYDLKPAVKRDQFVGPPSSSEGQENKTVSVGRATMDAWLGEVDEKDMGVRFELAFAHFGPYLGDVRCQVLRTFDGVGWGGEVNAYSAALLDGSEGRYHLGIDLRGETLTSQYNGFVEFEASPTGFSTDRSGDARLQVMYFNPQERREERSVDMSSFNQ